MNLRTRVKNALTAFSGNNKVNNSLTNAATDFLRYGNNKAMYQDWSQVEISDQDMYTGYPYAALDKRANRGAILGKNFLYTKASQSLMDLSKAKGTEVIHPYLPLVSESLEFTENEFWYNISTYLDLEGIYYLMAVRAVAQNADGTTKVGDVQKFSLINPYQIRRVVSQTDGTVGGYIESRPGVGYREIPKELIIEIRKLNPFNNDDPYSITDAAKESQFTMKQAGDYARHSIKGNINSPGAITTDVVLEDHIFDNFVSRIKNHEKGEPLYGNGAGAINWASMQVDLDKAALDKINDINKSILFSVAGVSDIMMGKQEAGTGRETSKTQKDDFTENAVMPQIEKIIDALNLDYRKWYTDEWTQNKYEIALDNPLESDRDAELKDIEIRQAEHDMVVALVNLGYEFELAVKYAHGDISLLELGEPTLEPQLTAQAATQQAAAAVGLPAPGSGNIGEDPNTPTQGEDPNTPTGNGSNNKLIHTGSASVTVREVNYLTPVRMVKPEENEKTLKSAIKEAEKQKKKIESDAKKADIESKKILDTKEDSKEEDINEEDEQSGQTKEDKDTKEQVLKIEVTTPNGVQKGLKAYNQIASRDFPDLYDDIDIDMDNLGCIMMDTEKIPIAQYITNPDQDLYSDGEHTGLCGETEPHVTLLYGLLENGNVWKDKVDAVLKGWTMPTVTIDQVSYFDLGDSYAIIGLVKPTPELLDGHDRLTLLPHINTFSEYTPHITLAYIDHNVDPQKWVLPLAKKYNGQKIATTGINYGDLPDEESNGTSNDNSIVQPTEEDTVTKEHNHVEHTNTTLEKARNALEDGQRDQTQLQESNLYQAVSRIEGDLVIKVIASVKKGNFDEANDLLAKAETNSLESELATILKSFFVVLFPIYGNQLMSTRASQFHKQGFFAMTNDVDDYINKYTKKAADSHITTILNDLRSAAIVAHHNAAETALIELVEKGVQAQQKDLLRILPANPNREDIVKAVKQGKFDDTALYKRARDLAREGNGLDQITTALKKEYQNISQNRARTIARHETNRVFNMAQYQADLQFLKESGYLPDAYKVLRNRANDPCPVCAKIIEETNKHPIPFTQNFVDLGETITASYTKANGKMAVQKMPINYEPIVAGNVHVNCRCEYVLLIKQPDGTFQNNIDCRIENILPYVQNKGGNPNHDKMGRFSEGANSYMNFTDGDVATDYINKNYDTKQIVEEPDLKAVQSYTGSGYRAMNDYLRHGNLPDKISKKYSDILSDFSIKPSTEDLGAKVKDQVQRIETLQDSVSLKSNMYLYRAANIGKELKPGDTFVDKGFSSTSLTEHIAHNFNVNSSPIKQVLQIKAKKGTHGIFPNIFNPTLSENEFILKPNTQYKITNVTKKSGYDLVEASIS